MHNVLIKLWREYRGFALFVILMIIFRSALADWNTVPTGSMKPTIVEGDRIFVNKLAYDLRVPLTHISIYKFGDPKRGDIVVFDSKAADTRLVKRVIGLPGDVVEMRNNRLTINGIEAQYSNVEYTAYAIFAIESYGGSIWPRAAYQLAFSKCRSATSKARRAGHSSAPSGSAHRAWPANEKGTMTVPCPQSTRRSSVR